MRTIPATVAAPVVVTVLAAPVDGGELSPVDRGEILLTELAVTGLVEQPVPGGRLRVTLYLDPLPAGDDHALIDAVLRLLGRVGGPLWLRWLEAEPQLVSVPEIATRIGVTREAVRLWTTGARGPGSFPAPAGQSGASSLYDWAEVTAWLPAVGHEQFERPLHRHLCAVLTTRLATHT